MYGRFPPPLGKIVVGLVAMSFAVNGWGEWKSCKDAFGEKYKGSGGTHSYTDITGNLTQEGEEFTKKYCVEYSGANTNCAGIENSGSKPPPEYCINCSSTEDCAIIYKVVLENNPENNVNDYSKVNYAVYAKLQDDNGEDISSNSETTCPLCSQTKMIFYGDTSSGEVDYKINVKGSGIADTKQARDFIFKPWGECGEDKDGCKLSKERYTKVGTLTFPKRIFTFKPESDLEELRAKIEINPRVNLVEMNISSPTFEQINLEEDSFYEYGSSEQKYRIIKNRSSKEDVRFKNAKTKTPVPADAHNDGSISSIDLERKDYAGDNYLPDACCEIVIHGLNNDDIVFGGSANKDSFEVNPADAVKNGIYGKWSSIAPNKEQYSLCRNKIPYDDTSSPPELSPRQITSASVLVYGLPEGQIQKVEWRENSVPKQTGGLHYDLKNLKANADYKIKTTINGNISCEIRFRTKKESLVALFQRAADCHVYTKLRDYYVKWSAAIYGTDYFYRKEGKLTKGGKKVGSGKFDAFNYNEEGINPDGLLLKGETNKNHVVVVVRAKNIDGGSQNSIIAYGEFKDQPYGKIEFKKLYSGSDETGTNLKKDQLIYFQACLLQDESFSIEKKKIPDDIKNCTKPIPFAFNACPTISDWNFHQKEYDKPGDDLYTSLGLCLATKEFTYGQLVTESVEGIAAIPPLPLWYPSPMNNFYPLHLYAARFDPEPCQVVADETQPKETALCYQIDDQLYEAEEIFTNRPVPNDQGECTYKLAERFHKRENEIYTVLKAVENQVNLKQYYDHPENFPSDKESATELQNNIQNTATAAAVTSSKDKYLPKLITDSIHPKNPACISLRKVYVDNSGEFTFPICPSGADQGEQQVIVSPLVLDITGKGIRVSRDFTQAVAFDMWGRKQPMLVDWPINTSDVAFLVLPNKSGKVDSIRELFGNYKARNGFLALAKYDKNQDGQIDKKDKIFSRLRLWFDRNRNGVCDKEELKTLATQGVQYISLNYGPVPGEGIARWEKVSSYYDQQQKRVKNIKDVYFAAYTDEGEPLKPNRVLEKSSVKVRQNR